MHTTFFVLVVLLVLFYLWTLNSKTKTEPMTFFRYRPLTNNNPASIDFDENITGLSNFNSTESLPNVNQYANNLAFNPNDPNSANLMLDGQSIMDRPAYQYMGNKDGQTAGRNVL
jgi:hypothetical protein